MKPSIDRDISAAEDTLAKLAAKFGEMEPADLVDIGARLNAMATLATNIVKGWEGKRDGARVITRDGIKQIIRPRAKLDATTANAFAVMGQGYRAIFAPYIDTRISTSLVREKFPDVAAACTVQEPQERLNFKPVG